MNITLNIGTAGASISIRHRMFDWKVRPLSYSRDLAFVRREIDQIDALVRLNRLDESIQVAQYLRKRFEDKLEIIFNLLEFRIPNIILAGPAKTATTWLRGSLGKHPSINTANGEPNILFNILKGELRSSLKRYYDNNIWRDSSKQNALFCEKSPSYVSLPDHIIKIVNALSPNTKIVIGKRNEKDRLWSAIHHKMRDFHYSGSWISFCTSHKDEIIHQINSGQIDNHINRWRTIFGRDSILVVSFSIIETSPRDVIDEILRHVGVHQISELKEHEKHGIISRLNSREHKINIEEPPDDLIDIISSILG